jgi:hypothetical protein
VTGATDAFNFPTVNPIQASVGGASDVFISKLTADGSALVFSTYLGGISFDAGEAIALDSLGNIYVAGTTGSVNFPIVNAFQPQLAFGFIAKLNPSGSALIYSTFFGGASTFPSGLAVDSAGNIYLTGDTQNNDLPTKNAYQSTLKGIQNAFVAKINAAGTALIYSTYLGGTNQDVAYRIALDPSGSAYVVGYTNSVDFPTKNPIQPAYGGGVNDGFIAKLDPSGSSLVYSTYLGGSSGDIAQDVAVNAAGNAYVTGGTDSPNFPVANALQPALSGVGDAFICELNTAGSAFVYSTFLGGSGGDGGWGIALDLSGNTYVVGETQSTDFPTANPLQPSLGGGSDIFISKLNAGGSSLVYSTYLGGPQDDLPRAIAVDVSGAYITGNTLSADFPLANPIQSEFMGVFCSNVLCDSTDGIVAKITEAPFPAIMQMTPIAGTQGQTVLVNVTGQNFVNGSTVVAVSGTGVTAGSVTVSSPTSLTASLTISGSAQFDTRDFTVKTPTGTSNRIVFTIFSATPGCHVSLPVSLSDGGGFLHSTVGFASSEPTNGTWEVGVLYYNGSSISTYGVQLTQGTLGPVAPPVIGLANFYGAPVPIVGMVNAFLNPGATGACAYNVALAPGISPGVAKR